VRPWPSLVCGRGGRSPDGEALRTFAILTTAANGTMFVLHERMAVTLSFPRAIRSVMAR
jgi:putative SOS response-associated peptidase YedK